MTSLVEMVTGEATARHAHHEAGHAVAAVARGGTLVDIYLGHADWSTTDEIADTPGGTVHESRWEDQPFVTFAGPCATAMWILHNDPDVDDLGEALAFGWDEEDHDREKYDARVEPLQTAAAELGFPLPWLPWESEWCDELEELWPAIEQVAALLIDGQPVDHRVVAELVEQLRPQIRR
ncbi:hypothetical protein [Mycobacterium sp. IS-1556]|uniref:hypothetical protein n=1 Tax=Mycobacterium sp. IS-1556 TaxID=1772276 RepID=UPI00074161EF|nr:hypothetical protein [Mycobacterium sp. IS-1556]KUH90619.1 hypothetical protein AU187_24415 [Mycobacterium sp. IS-1556]